MKTLQQLWEERGFQPVLKVKHKGLFGEDYFVVMGQAPDGSFYGYEQSGGSNWFFGTSPEWYLYEEPKQRERRWECLIYSIYSKRFLIADGLRTQSEIDELIQDGKKVTKLRCFEIQDDGNWKEVKE